jgi:hypothetical protein
MFLVKTRFIIILLRLGYAWEVGAQTIDFNKLPAAVQHTVTQRKGSDKIKSIEFEARNGIAGYVVEFARRGFNPRLIVAPDGSVIEDHRVHVPSPKDENGLNWDLPEPAAKRVGLNAVPAAVRDRISRAARGRAVAEIKSKPHGDQQVFVVEFKQRGRNERVYILENGSLLAEQSKSSGNNRTALSGLGAPPQAQTGGTQK